VRWLETRLVSISILDARAVDPKESVDECVGDGAVRGTWRAKRDHAPERDRCALLFVDITSHEKAIETILRRFTRVFFRKYARERRPQTALYLGVQESRRVWFVERSDSPMMEWKLVAE
jgi:hypothetical protein